jgi:hypothetical protein
MLKFTAGMLVLMIALPCATYAQTHGAPPASGESRQSLEKQVEELRQMVAQLTGRVTVLEAEQRKASVSRPSSPAEPAVRNTQAFVQTERAEEGLSAAGVSGNSSQPVTNVQTAGAPEVVSRQAENVQPASGPEHRAMSLLAGTTINLTLDGYYGYNFNSPVGRVNLLRAYDVSSNSFSLNQATLILDHTPDPDAGRRFGARVDLQYGQATETLQGSASNELRPQAYRPIFQAYGTYVAPVGSGLTIDFGKWASALGIESNYTKDDMNYSRSYLFDFLPFYHMGMRASYNLTPTVNVTYWLVNGTQQSEDFNGFKSQAFLFTLKPASAVTWNVNYYFGQEQPDVVAVLNPTYPTEATQPGLPTTPIVPAPNGREHILDSYATWNATAKLTLAGEADYVINRKFSTSAPGHATAGAAYARYQLTPRLSFAGRAEYFSDRGGLFSGVTQALKETTFTTEYRWTQGFLVMGEWRRDFSNQPFFLTSTPNILKTEQNTATVGLVWWWGEKEGTW